MKAELKQLLNQIIAINACYDDHTDDAFHPDVNKLCELRNKALALVPQSLITTLSLLMKAEMISVFQQPKKSDGSGFAFDVKHLWTDTGNSIDFVIHSDNWTSGMGYSSKQGQTQASELQKFFQSFIGDHPLEVTVTEKKKGNKQ